MKLKESSRLYLREFTEKDFESIHEYASDAQVVKYQMWGPNTEEETRSFLACVQRDKAQDDRRKYEFAVIETKSGKHIGGCSIFIDSRNSRAAEIGYILNRAYWNNGYGTDICKMIIEYAFDDLCLSKLMATCDKKNRASYRVMEQNGFRFSCEIRDHMIQKGENRDTLEYMLEKRPKHIFAIGGGEINDYDTLSIDKAIVETIPHKRKKVLFISTASKNADYYVDAFKKVYERELGCMVTVMSLVDNNQSQIQMREIILCSDIIYVGEGNTKYMLGIWKKYGIQKALKEAFRRGITIAGLSAGAICWFKEGHSDTISFLEKGDSDFSMLDGLGFVNALCCPNYNDEERRQDFIAKVKAYDLQAIALEDNACLEIVDGRFRILKSKANARAFELYMKNNKLVEDELDNEEFISIYNLF